MAISSIGGVERKARPAKIRKGDSSLLAAEMAEAMAVSATTQAPPPPAAAPTPLITPATALAAQQELESGTDRGTSRRNPEDDIPEDWRR
jgi:hypothetical protein